MAPAIKKIESECHEIYSIKICVGKAGKISFITMRKGVTIIFYNKG